MFNVSCGLFEEKGRKNEVADQKGTGASDG